MKAQTGVWSAGCRSGTVVEALLTVLSPDDTSLEDILGGTAGATDGDCTASHGDRGLLEEKEERVLRGWGKPSLGGECRIARVERERE